MQSHNRGNANGMSSRMRGAVSSAMSQPRRQPTSAAQAQLDPNWQRKMNGGTNRYQPSNTFLPRQGAQQNQNSGKSNSRMGVTSRQPANAFDAKAFLRQQRPGEFLRPNANQNAQPQQTQPTQQQRFQQQQRAKVGTNDANFDINAFKRAAPRMQTMNESQQSVQQQQPVQQQRVIQQQQQPTQQIAQQQVRQPVQQQTQQMQSVPRQQSTQIQRVQPQQQPLQQPIQRVQSQQQPLQQPIQRVQPQQQAQRAQAAPQQQVQQRAMSQQAQPRTQVQQHQAQQKQQQQVVPQQQTTVDEDEDVDDKLPWQSASQNVASRIQKGASSKDVLQKIAALRQAAPEPEIVAAPTVAEVNVLQNEEIDGQAPAEPEQVEEEAPRIY